MNADTIFSLSNMLALVGWLILLGSPFFPRLADRIAGLLIPGLLAVAYCGLVLAFWSSAKGGFDSLDNVAALFQTRELLLAGWIHYLAFDLFVGAWIVRTARQPPCRSGWSFPAWRSPSCSDQLGCSLS